MHHGFYWPTASEYADQLVHACNGFQRFVRLRHMPTSVLKTILITWPFSVWGLDMVGPFKRARAGMTQVLVAVEKFTKWIKVKPIRKLDGTIVVTFFREIIIQFG